MAAMKEEIVITIDELVAWLLAGGFMVFARWIVSIIPALQSLVETKRALITSAFATVIVGAAYYGATVWGILPQPADVKEWLSALVPYFFLAWGVPELMSTLIRDSQPVMAGSYSIEVDRAKSKWLGHHW